MSEARQAVELAAEEINRVVISRVRVNGSEAVEWEIADKIEKHVTPLLAVKDAEIDRLAAQVEQLRANLSPHGIRRWWRFDDNQQPLSSWHEREDFIARITAALAEQPHV